MSTIAAISTPVAAGGISLIRISGKDAVKIASEVFSPLGNRKVSEMKGYTAAYGKFVVNDEEIDDGIITIFKAPKSYTGEDVAELSCHGGIYVTKKLLRAVIDKGAVPAAPGEFTKRAFLNGKMTLTEAEAVMDIISSQGEQAHKAAVTVHEGILYKKIKVMSDRLVTILSELAAWVDYPEEDIPDLDTENLQSSLNEVISSLLEILKTYDSGKIIREGIETVIAGCPNVGKSTLMNLLSGYERSIVTDIAGTTRDVVEESVRMGDVVLRLSDTAGIRQTSDLVEGYGVNLAYRKIETAALILAVFDNSQQLSDEDLELIEKIKGKNVVAVINKTDMDNRLDNECINKNFKYVVNISAKTGDGTEKLKNTIENIFKISEIDTSSGIIANERQRSCVEKAVSSLKEAFEALETGETLDAVTVLIDEGESYLLELTGEKITEAVVNEVFSHFCVGK